MEVVEISQFRVPKRGRKKTTSLKDANCNVRKEYFFCNDFTYLLEKLMMHSQTAAKSER